MRNITHLNSATLTPYYPKLTGIVWCMLVKHASGYVLIDTGLGIRDFETPAPSMRLFKTLMRITDPKQAIVNQIRELGLQPEDIKHIVLTHTHLDHAGGLSDFPQATVHIYAKEFASLQHPRLLLDRGHIKAHFDHQPHWSVHEGIDTLWFGFDAIIVMPDILLIPLPGHTSGHCGVAVKTDTGWILHAGDAISPFHKATDPDKRGASRGYPMNWIPEKLAFRMLGDHTLRLAELIRNHGDQVKVISAHDSIAFGQLKHTMTTLAN